MSIPNANTTESTIMRNERVVVLPHNTLKFVDMPLEADILASIEHFDGEITFHELLYALSVREEKSLAALHEISENTVDDMLRENYPMYYDVAPETEVYTILDVLHKQSFGQNITILYPFDYTKLQYPDPAQYNKDWYDGSYEELVKKLIASKFTCLVIGDIDLLDKLTKDGRINFENTTVFVSVLGYNYKYDEELNIHVMRKYRNITGRTMIDIGAVKLFNFQSDDFITEEEATDDGE